MDTREVDLSECLMAHPQVDAIWSDCELKRYCLMSFRHVRESPVKKGVKAEFPSRSKEPGAIHF